MSGLRDFPKKRKRKKNLFLPLRLCKAMKSVSREALGVSSALGSILSLHSSELWHEKHPLGTERKRSGEETSSGHR